MAKKAVITSNDVPAAAPAGWVVLQEGWYCGRFMKAGEPVTHVDLGQLTADEGHRVERRAAGNEG